MKALLIPLALLLPAASVSAAISYTTPGFEYEQDFDTLADSGTSNAWANDTTVEGWYWWSSSNTAPNTYRASNTTTATQNFVLSLGKLDGDSNSGTTGDRAFGGQGTTNNTITYGMQLLNTTGTTLNSFTLKYTGEQWRTINVEARDKLTLEYAVFATEDPAVNRLATTSTTGWTSIAALQFDAPSRTTAAAPASTETSTA